MSISENIGKHFVAVQIKSPSVNHGVFILKSCNEETNTYSIQKIKPLPLRPVFVDIQGNLTDGREPFEVEEKFFTEENTIVWS